MVIGWESNAQWWCIQTLSCIFLMPKKLDWKVVDSLIYGIEESERSGQRQEDPGGDYSRLVGFLQIKNAVLKSSSDPLLNVDTFVTKIMVESLGKNLFSLSKNLLRTFAEIFCCYITKKNTICISIQQTFGRVRCPGEGRSKWTSKC